MQKLLIRKNSRLKNYDYFKIGRYFTTICSKNRENIFAKYDKNIVSKRTGASPVPTSPVRYLKLTKMGQIIEKQHQISLVLLNRNHRLNI